MIPDPKVTAQVLALPNMELAELEQQWREVFGAEPIFNKRELMIRGLAYRIQEMAYGGVDSQLRNKIRRGSNALSTSDSDYTPGTEFVREYKGVEYRVTVLDDGTFQYGKRRYKSLSAIATHITGHRRSGQDFFGVYKKQNAR